jgi:hypothetical protein
MKGTDYQEVISGLKEGENVVISDSPISWKKKPVETKN